ncbi:MAG: cyclic nucleotide-binding domain-containing protein [Verrucomicrobia bacterium]|nr:cyclic nucleotide-binding domain-containing protein [Verrucomicrobiota bacterium]
MAKTPQTLSSLNSEKEEVDHLTAIKKLPAFRGVTLELISKLLESSVERFILQGDFIFKQDDPASSLVIFSKGFAVECKRIGEVDCVVNFYDEISILGESSFLESCSRSTSLFANEDCWVIEIDNHCLKKFAFTNPDQFETLYMNLGRELGKKVLGINEKINQANEMQFIRESRIRWATY